MEIFKGFSKSTDPVTAVREATLNWKMGQKKPDLLLAFCSTEQNAGAIAKVLAEQFPQSPMAGCTTAGEILGDRHFNGSFVLMGICSPEIKWSTHRIEGVRTVSEAQTHKQMLEMLSLLNISSEDLNPEKHFALLFMDGLSGREEVFVPTLSEALEGIPILGGSAGDDLKFKKTEVIFNGTATDDAAVLIFGQSEVPFGIIKHQHFLNTARTLVITKADPANRKIIEIDGYPAAEGYARALGLRVEDLTTEIAFSNPLTFSINKQIYVRSIQKVEDDFSLSFFCSIEEGMVLEIGGHEDMEIALARDLKSLEEKMGKADLFIASNCILRSLEAASRGYHDKLSGLLGHFSQDVIGFDTYGEQLNGLHINQTLVGIAFGKTKAA